MPSRRERGFCIHEIKVRKEKKFEERNKERTGIKEKHK
jgi:hypothetical protein